MRIWWREFWPATARRSVACTTGMRGWSGPWSTGSAGRPDRPDLTQECFLRAYRNLARLRQPDRFGSWIVGIARQVAREHRRSSGATGIGSWRRVARDGSDPDVAGAVQTAEQIELVLRRVAELPERERLAVHAFFLQECDAEQAARLLKLSRSGVYALLERALARLAAGMSRGARKGSDPWLASPETACPPCSRGTDPDQSAHLKSCDRCRAALESMRSLVQELAQAHAASIRSTRRPVRGSWQLLPAQDRDRSGAAME